MAAIVAIRESRITNSREMLKPQDVVIIGKVLAKGRITAELQMSPSEVDAGLKRAVRSGLCARKSPIPPRAAGYKRIPRPRIEVRLPGGTGPADPGNSHELRGHAPEPILSPWAPICRRSGRIHKVTPAVTS